jgi:hypothetical protein
MTGEIPDLVAPKETNTSIFYGLQEKKILNSF